MIDLRLGDCIDILSTLEDSSVDLVITSPPYNLGNDHHSVGWRFETYDDEMDELDYQAWQIRVLRALYRVVSDNGSLFYNHKNRIRNGRTITPYEWLLRSGWVIKQEIIWNNGTRNFDDIRFYPRTERVYWLAKSEKTKLKNTIKHHDIFDWKPVGTNGEHKRAFPIEMVKDILACFPDAKTILDPFAGSGTVAAVCDEAGLDFIGCEINPKYFEIAQQRLSEAIPA